jgi:hypothetical protein
LRDNVGDQFCQLFVEHLLRRPDKLGPIFEMHRVVVIPLAAPDETVRLEDADDLPGDPVSISD